MMQKDKGQLPLTEEQWLAKLKIDYPPFFQMVQDGYIKSDLTPLKCTRCDCSTFKEINRYYLDGPGSTLLEFDEQCVQCGYVVGHWAYGNYTL